MKLFLASAVVGLATAFNPIANSMVRSKVSLNEATTAVEGEAPASVPEPAPKPVSKEFCNGWVGGEGPEPMPFTTSTSVNWDPCGFVERSPEWLPWYREAELKHGRVAMLACAGIVTPEIFRIPGEQFSFESIPKVIDAHDALPDSMIQIFGWISFLEACTFGALSNMNEFDRQPGDYGFDPLGLYPETEEKQREMQLAELKNGRLAMIAIGGMVTGASVSGHGFPYLA